MGPEDGRLTTIDLDDKVSTTAFRPFGVENLKSFAPTSSRTNPGIAATQPRPITAAVLRVVVLKPEPVRR